MFCDQAWSMGAVGFDACRFASYANSATMRRCTLVFVLSLLVSFSANDPADAQGVLTGDSGGNEREVSVFDRSSGQVWRTVTGVTGRFRSKSLPAGEYLAVSGSVFTPVRIEDGKATELLFGGQAGMSADTETWSPARRKFGQTFRSVGPSVDSFRFWNPGSPIDLVAELRESGPSGRLVARRELDAVSWIRIVDVPPGEWLTARERTYYLSIESVDRTPFRIGMPALGDVYPHGAAYYDDRPVLDSDLGISIRQDNDSLRTMVRVTLHEGLGFRAKGPASGSPTWAAQTFVASAANLRTAWINAGWPSAEGATRRFVFSVHENAPDGKRVGPERTVTMIKDWGATAVWFSDQVPLRNGERYAVKIRREDGKPFYAYLAPDRYAHGEAVRSGLGSNDMDLTCSFRGEDVPGSTILPCNVRLERLTPTSATIAWETAYPTSSVVELLSGDSRSIHDESAKTRHRMNVERLTAGSEYRFRVGGRVASKSARLMLSKPQGFTTLEDPSVLRKPRIPEGRGEPVDIENPSFELGLKDWTLSPVERGRRDPELPGDVGNLRAVSYLGRYSAHTGQRVLGWNHKVHERSGPIPRKIDPAVTRIASQVVATEPGREYELSAWVCTDERQGGWNRNDRVRLVIDPTASGRLESRNTVNEDFATQWYTTRGKWKRFRLRFVAQGAKTTVGVQLYQWWLLAENHLYVDDVELTKLPNPTKSASEER